MGASSKGTKRGIAESLPESDPVEAVVPANTNPAPVPIGQRLGQYLVTGQIGEGGMGTVYLAEHTLIGRKCAIKLLNPDVSTDQEAVSRFFTEARAVNQIRHPNIVEVTDFGDQGGRYFIVMEYLEGETLAKRLQRVGMFDEVAAVNVGRQVASALGAAHSLGMVHRDLKPANVFLRDHPDYPDFVKVLDFGIAKLLAPDAGLSHQTRNGAIIGTPAYMSPEQCLGEPNLDHRSDIYSLGVVLYGMLTGRLPFRDDSFGQLVMAHVMETPRPPHEVNARVSRSMSAVIMKALAKKREERFPSMKEMRQALDGVIGYTRTPTPMGVPVMMMPEAAQGPAPSTPKPTPKTWSEAAAPATVVQKGPPATGAFQLGKSSEDGLVDKLVSMVRERVAGKKIELPPLSGPAAECLDMLGRTGGFSQLASIVGQSPALTSKVIRLANSSLFPSLAPSRTLEQSIGRLGEQGLRRALIEFEARPIIEAMGRDVRVKNAFRRPWFHATATVIATERLCGALGVSEREQPLLEIAATLQDIGLPLVASYLIGVERQASGPRGPRFMSDDAWMRAVALTGRSVSVAVAEAWGLPEPIVTAIAEADGNRPRAGRGAHILRLASAYADRDGFYLRRGEQEAADAVIAAVKPELGLDDKTEAKMLLAFNSRVNLVAGIRG